MMFRETHPPQNSAAALSSITKPRHPHYPIFSPIFQPQPAAPRQFRDTVQVSAGFLWHNAIFFTFLIRTAFFLVSAFCANRTIKYMSTCPLSPIPQIHHSFSVDPARTKPLRSCPRQQKTACRKDRRAVGVLFFRGSLFLVLQIDELEARIFFFRMF